MEKKYEWSANVSAPREYPIEVYTGAAGGYFFSQMGGFSNAGWGAGSSVNYITAPLPDRLDMTWLSYVDNKFYTGDWKLPTEKIQQLFDKGFYSITGSEAVVEPYTSINIGLAPKGMVVVWVAGAGKQVEIVRFQAHETTIDPKLITESEKYMFKDGYSELSLESNFVISQEVREQLQLYGYPAPEMYEAYREKYNWKPKIILPDGCKISSIYIKMCNGEIEDPYDRPIDQKSRAIPFTFEIFWSVANGKKEQKFVSRIAFTKDDKFWAKYLKEGGGQDEMPIDFGKTEIRTLFKELIDKSKAAEMVIKIDSDQKEDDAWITSLCIKQGEKKYNLTQFCQDSGKLN